MSNSDFVVHTSPVWRAQANFIIDSDIQQSDLPRRFEQIWARQVAEARFEICCIPFFVYDLALGDEVETAAKEDRQYLIARVVRRSGHFTLRVWFGDVSSSTTSHEVATELSARGCELEWYSTNLLAVDAPTGMLAQAASEFLRERERMDPLLYETGWTG